MPDIATWLVWIGLILMVGVLMWEWGADWFEEFRRDDGEWWDSLTDEAKQELQQQVDSQDKRLDEHEKRIDALDDTAITVSPKNDANRNKSSSK